MNININAELLMNQIVANRGKYSDLINALSVVTDSYIDQEALERHIDLFYSSRPADLSLDEVKQVLHTISGNRALTLIRGGDKPLTPIKNGSNHLTLIKDRKL